MDIDVREEHLAGIGVRWEVDLDDETTVYVVAERNGRRLLGSSRSGSDEPDWTLELDQNRAVVIAALLLGARFVPGDAAAAPQGDATVVETVEVGRRSPLLGLALGEISLPDPDAIVLAILDDDTPELVEAADAHRCGPGDRVVLAARANRIAAMVDHVRGPA